MNVRCAVGERSTDVDGALGGMVRVRPSADFGRVCRVSEHVGPSVRSTGGSATTASIRDVFTFSEVQFRSASDKQRTRQPSLSYTQCSQGCQRSCDRVGGGADLSAAASCVELPRSLWACVFQLLVNSTRYT